MLTRSDVFRCQRLSSVNGRRRRAAWKPSPPSQRWCQTRGHRPLLSSGRRMGGEEPLRDRPYDSMAITSPADAGDADEGRYRCTDRHPTNRSHQTSSSSGLLPAPSYERQGKAATATQICLGEAVLLSFSRIDGRAGARQSHFAPRDRGEMSEKGASPSRIVSREGPVFDPEKSEKSVHIARTRRRGARSREVLPSIDSIVAEPKQPEALLIRQGLEDIQPAGLRYAARRRWST